MLTPSLDICTKEGLSFHTPAVVTTVRHTVVESRVSLNAGCVDPS